MKAGGAALGGYANAAAENRGSALDAELYREQLDQSRQADYRNAAAQREQGRREGGKDAFRSLQHADYVARGGGEYQPKAGTPGYGFGPRKSSTSEIAAAELFRAEQEARLKAGDSLLPKVNDPGRYEIDESLLKAGTGEKLASFGSLAANVAGALPNSVIRRGGSYLAKLLKGIF